ncbi:hypothetical protein ABPG72_000691 [Tetrahymena utriculariae]
MDTKQNPLDIPLLPIKKNDGFTAKQVNQNKGDQQYREFDYQSYYSNEKLKNLVENLICKVDFDQIPPDFKLAEDHKKATRVGPLLNQKGNQTSNLQKSCDRCDCCGRNVDRKALNLDCQVTDLSFLGSGFPMFFQFIKLTTFYLIFILLVGGLYNIFNNEDGNQCQQHNALEGCFKNWVNVYTLGNRSKDSETIMMQQWLNLLTLIGLVALVQFIIYSQRQQEQLNDQIYVSPGDYTVMINNIPVHSDNLMTSQNVDVDSDLKKFLEDHQLIGADLKVAKINLCYNLSELYKLRDEKQKIVKEKQKILKKQIKQQNFYDLLTVSFLDEKIKQSNQKIEDFEQKMAEGKGSEFMSKYFVGIALVSLETESQKEQLLQLAEQKQFLYKNIYLEISQAPEPTEIFWENLNVSILSRIIRIAASILLGLAFLACGSFFIYYLCEKQYNYVNSLHDVTSFYEKAVIQIIPLLISCLISIINQILVLVVGIVVDFKRLHTRTYYNLAFAYFVCIAQFGNSILVPLLVKVMINETSYYSMLYNRSGVLMNQNHIFLFNTFLPLGMFFVSYPNLIKNFIRNRVLKNQDKCVLTQKELQNVFEEPPFLIEFQYSQTMRTLFMTLAYCTIMPFCLIYSILALIIQYFTAKYDLIKRTFVPFNMGSSLSYNMIKMLKMSIIIYSLSSFFFTLMTVHSHQFNFPAFIGIIISIVHFFIPIQKLNLKYFKIQRAVNNSEKYDKVKLNFITDYDRENPATKRQATMDFLKVTEKKQQLEQFMDQIITPSQNKF